MGAELWYEDGRTTPREQGTIKMRTHTAVQASDDFLPQLTHDAGLITIRPERIAASITLLSVRFFPECYWEFVLELGLRATPESGAGSISRLLGDNCSHRGNTETHCEHKDESRLF